jgi:hypothetical protein
MIIEFKILCAECGGELDHDMDLRKETITITPCPGCLDNAKCDGYYEGQQDMKAEQEAQNDRS